MSSVTTLPGSAGLPLIGETPSFLADALSFVETRIRQYGRLFRTHLLTQPTIISASYSRTLALLRADLDAAPAYAPFLRPVYPHPNLLLAPHTSPRRAAGKALLHACQPPQLHAYAPVVARIVAAHVSDLRARAQAAHGTPVRPYAFFKRVAEHVITTLVLGDLSAQQYDTVRSLCSDHFNGVVAAPVSVSVLGRRSARARGQSGYKQLWGLVDGMLGARLTAREAGENKNCGTCVLDAVVPSVRSGAASREDAVQFVLLMLSTAVPKCVASALGSLVREARRDEKVLDAVRGDEEGVACAVMETLRLHPPLLGGMRAAGEGDGGGKGRIEGMEVEAGWRVWYSIRHCNTDAEVYEEVGRFRAGRWRGALRRVGAGVCPFAKPGEAEEGATRTPMTFGAGERHCPGRDVAWMVMVEMAKRLFEAVEVERDGGEEVALRLFPVLREERDEEVSMWARDPDGDGGR